MAGAKQGRMFNPTIHPLSPSFHANSAGFWPRILTDEALSECNDLEKLLIGCELIAAFDGAQLLAA